MLKFFCWLFHSAQASVDFVYVVMLFCWISDAYWQNDFEERKANKKLKGTNGIRPPAIDDWLAYLLYHLSYRVNHNV